MNPAAWMRHATRSSGRRDSLIDGRITGMHLSEGREPVRIDTEELACFGLKGPVVADDQAENGRFRIVRHAKYPDAALVPCIADICDTKRADAIFAAEKPDVTFHGAAHKPFR